MYPTGNLRLTDFAQVVPAIMPVNLASGVNAGDWINMAHFHRCAIIVVAAAGTAANDLTITMSQATDNTGAGSKSLNFTRVDVKQGADLAAIGQFSVETQAAADSYTEGTNGEEQLLYVLDFGDDDLDVANGFDHVQPAIAQVGAAKIGAVIAIPYGPKFGAQVQRSVL